MEPLIHFVVPFIALTLVDVESKKALPISLFALLPDLDALFLVHRSLSHSVVVVLVVALPFLLLSYVFKPKFFGYVLLAFLAVGSHLVFDVFAGYTPILWPLYGYSVWIKTGLVAHIASSPSLVPNAQLFAKPIKFQHFQSLDAPLFTGEGLILSTVLLLPVLLGFLRLLWKRGIRLALAR